jgi:mannose-6-phosphate isomerase-like protein (cupin superfamily)
MDGKYPLEGYSLNDVCTETIYVLDGILEIEIDGENFQVKKDDICIILPGKKYKITGKGEVLDLITPSWDSSQNHIIN